MRIAFLATMLLTAAPAWAALPVGAKAPEFSAPATQGGSGATLVLLKG